MGKFIILTFCLLLMSCSGKEKQQESTKQPSVNTLEIGKYFYVDSHGGLHADKECINIGLGEEDGSAPYLINFVLSDTIRNAPAFYCNECVSDEMFELIEEKIQNNRNY